MAQTLSLTDLIKRRAPRTLSHKYRNTHSLTHTPQHALSHTHTAVQSVSQTLTYTRSQEAHQHSRKKGPVYLADLRRRSVSHSDRNTPRGTLQHTATHCNTLQHTALDCNTLQRATTHCNTQQHTATRSNTLLLSCGLCVHAFCSASHCFV